MSQVQDFYKGQNIFITGGTGFLGRVLFEKLLRSCPDIGTIYLLIRGKKGKSTRERINALVDDSVFHVLRSYYPDFPEKIVGVAGDIAEEGLGLSAEDRARITDEVSLIFHLAATVRFNEKLDRAVNVNVKSVKYIVDIAKACKNLKAAIHVSTAYSHCVQRSIGEKFYPPPMNYKEANELVEDVEKNQYSDEAIETFSKRVLRGWPNSYTFTKAIGEDVITEFAKEMPFAVFRPSIVMATYREPVPGWISGILGLPAMISGCALGIIHANLVEADINFDVVPVDYMCNALISCAWKTATTVRRHDEDIPVYNYVSGVQNPITWGKLCSKLFACERIFPTNKAIYYPSLISTNSRRIFITLDFFLHLMPGLIIDSIAGIFGKHPGMYQLARKIGSALLTLGYFSTQEWNFENQRVQNLWKVIGYKDKQIFPFNIQDLDWDEYTMKIYRSCRTYAIGDHDGSEEEAKRRQFYLYIIHIIVRLTFATFVFWIIWNVFRGWSFSTNWIRFLSIDLGSFETII